MFSKSVILSVLLFRINVFGEILNKITIKGNHFVDSETGKPFFIKGIDYQPGGSSAVKAGSDPLSDPDTCSRDIILMQQLGVNAIRVYSVDPKLNHDVCMSLLAAAGIYLILDVNTPILGQHINRYEPWTTYHKGYLRHIFTVIEAFGSYDNLLAFFAANEVVNDPISAQLSPVYMKAVIRDMKKYISLHLNRTIPVGYSAADDLSYRVSLPKYLECGAIDERVDFYGVNSYQWCGHNTFLGSGYDKLVEDYTNFSIPIILSEYGCNIVTPRIFEEIEALYSPLMTSVFSGGLVYEFTQEENNYGLVEILGKNEVKLLQDYYTLQEQLKKIKIPDFLNDSVTTAFSIIECQDEYENIYVKSAIPTTPSKKMIKNGVSARKGDWVPIKQNMIRLNQKIYDTTGRLLPLENFRFKNNFDIKPKNILNTKEDIDYDDYNSPEFEDKKNSIGKASKSDSLSFLEYSNTLSIYLAIVFIVIPSLTFLL